MRIALVHFNHTSRDNLVTWPDMRTARWKPNYGDFLVSASIVRQLHPSYEHEMISFGGTAREKCDVALIRGSTYLFPTFDFSAANKTIDDLDCSVAVVGLGAQHDRKDPKFLDNCDEAKSFVARLNERSASISVRGHFTAEVIQRLGGKNVQVTGCPSLFYSRAAPIVRVPELLNTQYRSIGVSIHAGLQKSLFCRAPERTRQLHGEVIAWAISNSSKLSLFEQGVPLEFKVCDDTIEFSERIGAAKEIIANIGSEAPPEQLIAHMVSVRSVEEWLSKARDLDSTVGFRFHGNMVALLQGKPCYYFVYDSRLEEFCELYDLPYQFVEDSFDGEKMVSRMVEHDWDRVNSGFTRLRAELADFYSRNGINSVI